METDSRPDEALAGLIEASVAVAEGVDERMRSALERALRTCEPLEIEEALLQSYLFLGYPAALNALSLWRDVSGREAPPAATANWDHWQERGHAVCQTVYGGQYDRLRSNVRRLHPDLEAWMVAEGYGKVLGRQGLSLAKRELCIVAMLSVQGASVRRQLHSHLRGALNAGAPGAAVEVALEAGLRRAGPAEARRAREVWAEVQRRFQDPAGPGPPT